MPLLVAGMLVSIRFVVLVDDVLVEVTVVRRNRVRRYRWLIPY